jgi:hypothetical protein
MFASTTDGSSCRASISRTRCATTCAPGPACRWTAEPAGGRWWRSPARRDGPYERNGANGVIELQDNHVTGLLGISAPLWGSGGVLLGALALTLPLTRRNAGLGPRVRAAAQALSRDLGARPADSAARERAAAPAPRCRSRGGQGRAGQRE